MYSSFHSPIKISKTCYSSIFRFTTRYRILISSDRPTQHAGYVCLGMCKVQDIYWKCKVPENYRSSACRTRYTLRKWRGLELIPCEAECGAILEYRRVVSPVRFYGRKFCPDCMNNLRRVPEHHGFRRFAQQAVSSWEDVDAFVQERLAADTEDDQIRD